MTKEINDLINPIISIAIASILVQIISELDFGNIDKIVHIQQKIDRIMEKTNPKWFKMVDVKRSCIGEE